MKSSRAVVLILIVVCGLWHRHVIMPTTIVIVPNGAVGAVGAVGGHGTGEVVGSQGTEEEQAWAVDLLHLLGNAAPAAPTVQVLAAWQRGEGTEALWNPLATTQPWDGATCFNYLSGHCGVKNYLSRDDGLNATVTTLTNGYYPTILAALQNNQPEGVLNDGELGTWGTGRGSVERRLRELQSEPGGGGGGPPTFNVPLSGVSNTFQSNAIEAGTSAVGINVRAALNARGGALRAFTIRPGETWSFNATIGDPGALQLATIIHPGDGWCNLAARYAQVARLTGLIPRFQDHGVGDLGGGPENSVAIWDVDGIPGTIDGRQDLELTNNLQVPISFNIVDQGDTISVIAEVGRQV